MFKVFFLKNKNINSYREFDYPKKKKVVFSFFDQFEGDFFSIGVSAFLDVVNIGFIGYCVIFLFFIEMDRAKQFFLRFCNNLYGSLFA